jgi:membrane-associated phospholipid phosphatase
MKQTFRIFGITLVFWLPVVVFCYLAGEVLEKESLFYDTAILHWIHSRSSPLLDTFFVFMTNLGSAFVIGPLTIALSALLYCFKRHKDALLLVISVIGASGANMVLKLLFHRDRPEFWPSLVHETSYSFPSGHAMASGALVFAVIAISWQTRWRWPVLIGGLTAMILIGISRLYLGVHYPTDVLAGWCASLAWVVTTAWAIHHAFTKFILKFLKAKNQKMT